MNKIYLLLSFALLCSSCGTASAQRPPRNIPEYAIEEKKQSFLLDGGLRDLTSSSIDKRATGLLGFRQEDMFIKCDFTVAAYSSQKLIVSHEVKDYSRTILNPFNSEPGVSLYASFLQRNFRRKGAYATQIKMMFEKRDEIKRESQRDSTFRFHNLTKYKKGFSNNFGYLIEFNLSNFKWANRDTTMQADGNNIAINPYVIKSFRDYWDPLDDFIEVILGAGPSMRIISGDLAANSELMRQILGVDKTFFFGLQMTGQISVKNFFAKGYYGLYNAPTNIDGLTHGQFYVTLGLQAEIGRSTRRLVSLSDGRRRR